MTSEVDRRGVLDRRSVLRWGVAGAAVAALPLTSEAVADASTLQDWSAACGAQWQQVAGACMPVLVTVSAEGPGAVPAGVVVRIGVDAAAVAGLAVRAAQTFDGAAVPGVTSERVGDGVRTVEWTLLRPLRVGQGIQLILDPVAGAPAQTPVAPIVSLVTTAPDPHQLPTGGEIAVPS